MRIVLVEYLFQATEIVEKKNYYKNDIIVSLDPETSYEFKRHKVEFFESSEFCIHENLWKKYKEITETSLKITKNLDEALFNSDERFKKLNWKLFDDYHYVIKICFDQLYYFAELISSLIEKYNPEEILVTDSKKFFFNEQFLLTTNNSVLKFLLKNLNNKKIKISHMGIGKKIDQKNKKIFSFGQPNHFFLNNKIKKKLQNIYYKTNFLKEYFFTKTNYLSIGCFEVEKLKKLYPEKTKNILIYSHESLHNNAKANNNFLKKFNEYLLNKTDYTKLVKHKNFTFQFILEELIKNILLFLDFYINQYKLAKKIVKNKNPECLIFQSMSPFYSSNFIFRKICNDLNVPFINWQHGGYNTYSLPGYDVVDYRLCKNHISYGDYLGDLIKDEKCVLNNLDLQKNQNIYSVGSPRFTVQNKNIFPAKKLEKHKYNILFMFGAYTRKNQFYFGYNRKNADNSLWKFQYEILCILKEYQDKYNIVFKDYPNGFPNMWKKVLNDIDAKKISYISDKSSVKDLLKMSDLNILPWMSTTFFESLYFESDIFIVDQDIYQKPFEGEIKKEIYCFKNHEKFKIELKKYLEEGKFYKTTKNYCRKYFLNLNNSKNMFEYFNYALNQVKNEKKDYFQA